MREVVKYDSFIVLFKPYSKITMILALVAFLELVY